MPVSAYEVAIQMLDAGTMPVVIKVEDDLHVLSVIPTSREVLVAMLDPNPQARLQLAVNVVREVKEAVVAGRVSP